MSTPTPLNNKFLSDILLQSPIVHIDVGAAGGIEKFWSELAVDKFSDCYGFEPFPDNFSQLKPSNNIQYFPIAISDQTATLPFYGRTTVGSLEGPPGGNRSYETITVETDTLDRLVEINFLPEIDSLKIDVEGHELSVLRGAESALTSSVLYLKTEFSFSSSFAKINDMLLPLGFCLFNFAANYCLSGNLGGGDVLYIRKVDSILMNDCLTDQQKSSMTLKLIAITASANLFPYSYYCLRRLSEAHICDPSVTDELISHFHKFSYLPALIPKSRIGKIIASVLFSATAFFSGFMAGKSAPKPNRLVPSRRFWIRNNNLPLINKGSKDYWEKIYKSACKNVHSRVSHDFHTK